jgi:hypothetical protein
VDRSIEISPRAHAMLDEVDERWTSEHGFDAENPLFEEVARAGELLREPGAWCSLPPVGLRRAVRRLLLRSGWHIYYSYDVERELVVIVAVWFANGGAEPQL